MEAQFKHCRDLLREHDYARYIASLYLDEELRQAAFAIFAFDVEISRIASQVSEPMPGEIRIQWWRDTLKSNEQDVGHPVAEALKFIINKYQLPLDKFDAILNAHIFDLYHDAMKTREDLETYLGETQSYLFQLLCMADGSKPDTNLADACGHSGVLFGIVKLLKALPFHYHRQQSYFPSQLSKHGQMDIKSQSQISHDWLVDISNYSERHYDLATAAIENLPVRLKKIFMINALSRAQLQNILSQGINLNKQTPTMSRLKTNWHLWRASRLYAD